MKEMFCIFGFTEGIVGRFGFTGRFGFWFETQKIVGFSMQKFGFLVYNVVKC